MSNLAYLRRFLGGVLLVLLVLFTGMPVACFGQVTAATISGTVRDETGAVLPGAELEITNVETGIKRNTMSQANGYFTLPGLPPGRYEARVSLQGFTTAVQNDISLSVAQQAAINFVLKVAATAISVEVVGSAVQVDTQTAALSAVVSERAITELPLNGRNFLQLATLQTGVSTFGGNNLVVNGMGTRSNSVLVDGSNLRVGFGTSPSSATGTTLGVETTSEFRIVTNSYSADYGRAMGGVINIVTKSGTNLFHGSAFEFFRNSAMDARQFFDVGKAPAPTPLPPFNQNQYGFSAGGPIRKNRLFFFAAFERLQSDKSQTQNTTTLNQAARSGICTGCSGTVNPTVKSYLDLFPVATAPLATDPTGASGIGSYAYVFDSTSREKFGQGRMDWQISDKDSIFGRYTIDLASQITPSGFLPFAGENSSSYQLFTLEEKRIFSPNLLNTARFSFSVLPSDSNPVQFTTIPSNLMFVPSTQQIVPGKEFLGNISITGINTTLGIPATFPSYNDNVYFTYGDDVSYSNGRHQFRMGGLVEHSRINKTSGSGFAGRYAFPSLAQFLAGNPNQFTASVYNGGAGRERPSILSGLYVQDDFRATSRFTLNLGLRYEFFTVPADVKGRDWQVRNVYTDTATTNGPPFLNPSLKNFAPRVGFAWDMKGDGSTSIRGGAGVYYDTDTTFESALGTTQNTPPLVLLLTLSSPPFPQPPPSSFAGGTGTVTPKVLDYHIKQPRSVSYNLNIQRRLWSDLVATVGYAGSSGNHLAGIYEANPNIPQVQSDGSLSFLAGAPRRNPAWSSLPLYTASGQSIYNSLQVSLSKSFSRSYRFQVAYTLSKARDSLQAQLMGDGGATQPQNPYNRKADWSATNFDARHVFSANLTWTLPSAGNALLRGWQLNMVTQWRTGNPFSVTVGSAANWSRSGNTSGPDRPNRNTSFSGRSVLGDPNRYYNPNAFVLPPQGTFGNVGRNSLFGPGSGTLDLSVVRNIHVSQLGEAGAVQLRAEGFNILNRANFGQPNGKVYTALSATEVPLATAGQITTVGPARQVQLGVKILF
jgi:carboxypeptidase family protein